MLFNTFQFLFVFLPICAALYYLCAKAERPVVASVSLVLSSLFFYAWWSWPYVFLLAASTAVNYGIGYYVRGSRHRGMLTFGIVLNLVALGYFKYTGFALQTANRFFGLHLPVPQIILPLAISFYTFTQIAFLVDAYRGEAREMNFARYCLFVFFFPHLIAGPIVHHKEIMSQFAKPDAQTWQPSNINVGLAWLTLGLFKKVIIADFCAPVANAVFNSPHRPDMLPAWVGLLAYTMQLYFDFSGYSDMAIGLSWLFNVRLPDNFNAPYRALDIADFWRRWHMTLSRFLRDYLYIPLGGNRFGEAARYRNLMTTMVLGGLWHGANWTFVLWGAYHGALLAFCSFWSTCGRALPVWLARTLTFFAVMVGWCLFRAETVDKARDILCSMFRISTLRLHALPPEARPRTLLVLAVLLLFVNFAPTTKQWIESRQLTPRHAVFLGVLFSIALFGMRSVALHFESSQFIYFQF